METDKNGMGVQDEQTKHEGKERQQLEQEERIPLSDSDAAEQASMSEENKKHRHHHEGNKRYRMFSNHSSANDQPHTRTSF